MLKKWRIEELKFYREELKFEKGGNEKLYKETSNWKYDGKTWITVKIRNKTLSITSIKNVTTNDY